MSEQQKSEAESAAMAAENLEHAQLRAQLEEATLPLMLDAMWAANVLDIESTLRHVCKKVGTTQPMRISRCLESRSSDVISMGTTCSSSRAYAQKLMFAV